MDESVLVVVGIVVGVALLYLGSRIRSRARIRQRPTKDASGK